MDLMTAPLFCTILARNYLPKALTLSESLRRHGSDRPLVVFLIDVDGDTELPEIEGVRWMWPALLDLDERTILELAMSYTLVEFATAVKPLLLKALLREHDQVAYLDPDTYVTAPMDELSPALEASDGIVLTPHYLEPTPPGGHFSEGHLLLVGVYNLGFCAVDRRAEPFLNWWWGHLESECLHDAIAGLFVDQKWVDVGAVLFNASALRHPGYNVSVANLPERPISRDEHGYLVGTRGDRLRLYHFHAFDPRRPDLLYNRTASGAADLIEANEALRDLCYEYAAEVLDWDKQLGPQPAYVYDTDQRGRTITPRRRQAYRTALRSGPVPSPFVPAEAEAYDRWRRSATSLMGRLIVSDVAKGMRCALPGEYRALKRRVPGLAAAVRSRYVESTGKWG
jgi:hypothetical protein